MSAPRLGFVGLGLMGKPMARNLLRAGYPLNAFNRSRGAVDELVPEGAFAADGLPALAERSDIVITMLPDGPDVAGVMRGDAGIFAGATAGALLIDMSTISPLTARELAGEARERGLGFIDAPVSGGVEGALDATLSIMVGGDPADVERADLILRVLGRTITHCGPSGAGQIVKACNQLVVALHIEAVAEALVLAQKAGVEAHAVLRVLGGGLAASRVMELRGASMAAHDFAPRGKAIFHRKDLGIALGLARDVNAVLPLTALVDQLFTALVANERGGWDHTALLSVLEDLGGSRR